MKYPRLIMLFIIILTAQLPGAEFLVKSFEKASNDISARRYEKIDLNGDACAIIKVQTDIPKPFAFNANTGIEAVEYRENNEIWIWVMPGARQLTIAKDGFITLKYAVPQRIGESDVFNMVLTGEGNTLKVSILTDPADAEKLVDGKLLGSGETFNIQPGEHELRVRKEGYRGHTQTIRVTEEDILFRNIVLKEIDVTPVSIRTEPAGADIFLNGELKGQTPWEDFLFPELYDLRVVKPGYLDIAEEVTITEDGPNDLNYSLVRNIAYLNISVSPEDAHITVDHEPSSAGDLELAPGVHVISAVKNSYLTAADTIVLEIGERAERNYVLTQNTGRLTVYVQPADADLIINKRDYGRQREIDLSPGSYRLELKHPKCFPMTDNIQIIRGETSPREYTMGMKFGSLQFKVKPGDAAVVMRESSGGEFTRWTGLKLMQEVPVGGYELQVTHPDYLDVTHNMQIEYDQRTSVDLELMSYAGSLQHRLDRKKLWRNVSLASTVLMSGAALYLELNAENLYAQYHETRIPSEAEDLIEQANSQLTLAGILSAGAGTTALPLIWFQIDVWRIKWKMNK